MSFHFVRKVVFEFAKSREGLEFLSHDAQIQARTLMWAVAHASKNAGDIVGAVRSALPDALEGTAAEDALVAELEAAGPLDESSLQAILIQSHIFPGNMPLLLSAAIMSLARNPDDVRGAMRRVTRLHFHDETPSMVAEVMKTFDALAEKHRAKYADRQ